MKAKRKKTKIKFKWLISNVKLIWLIDLWLWNKRSWPAPVRIEKLFMLGHKKSAKNIVIKLWNIISKSVGNTEYNWKKMCQVQVASNEKLDYTLIKEGY
jgi:hypothetical protein